ncbi:MAG: UDP-N-acetylglucosamine 2-epimerase (hydrolyzing) [Flavobacteriaceae bacterium]|nr:UDP-N-acetylglucosamine 2-epimerase (hydrolyzing) [Flavobacteriaceae bacterium]|tara:strand:- start:2176 stop:3333 length:1158 start_codon:yes stop_codon:yes gene_type:complete
MNNRKICVVITARPSYSRIKTVLSYIQDHPKLELQLVVAASALLGRYGTAINDIIKDGFEINAKVYNVIEGDHISTAAKTTGIGIIEISSVFVNLKPDIVVTVADRYETIATAISASYMNIPLAHIQGGEVTGNIDEKVRHAITKLSDYHFVSSENARKRVIRLGEDQDFVFNTGCPSIDLALQASKKKELEFNPYKKYGGVGDFPDYKNGYLVVMQHPVTNEYKDSWKQAVTTLKAIKKINMPTFWFWPNVDTGSDGTSSAIRSFREENGLKKIHFFKNMEGLDFLNLLNFSKGLIGNSSVGIRECAFLGVPVINIGSRQNKRDRGNNVIDVGYDESEIVNSINIILNGLEIKSSEIYGKGYSGSKIADMLSKVKLNYSKTICY